MTATRVPAWEGALNVRDLGGLPVAGGGTTRFGAVVRSAGLATITAAGWRELAGYGIRTIVDLRCPTEHDRAHVDGIHVVHAPLFRHDEEAFETAAAACTSWLAFYELVVETRARQIAGAVGAVADARAGGVLIHCVAGKDRTGIVAALLLSLAGVPDDAIADDYAASTEALRPVFEHPDDAECDPQVILAVLDRIRGTSGTVDAYLLEAGATAEQLARARARRR